MFIIFFISSIWILANLRYRKSDVQYRIIPIYACYVVCFDVLHRTRTILHVRTYDMDVQHRILGTYDIAIYDIVRLKYDVVCNIRCRMLHIRCRML